MAHQHSFYYLIHKMKQVKTTANSLGTVVTKQGRTPTWTAKGGEMLICCSILAYLPPFLTFQLSVYKWLYFLAWKTSYQFCPLWSLCMGYTPMFWRVGSVARRFYCLYILKTATHGHQILIIIIRGVNPCYNQYQQQPWFKTHKTMIIQKTSC